MPSKINMAGQIINGIEFINFSHSYKSNRIWNCKCHCGKLFTGNQYFIRSGKTTGCGCIRRIKNKENAQKLRKWENNNPEIHKMWVSMKNRCFNNSDSNYFRYGGRGISVYEGWKNSFDEYYNWIKENLGERPSKKYSLDRINNDGSYEPGNLRWADKSTQGQNSSNAKLDEQKIIEIRKSKLSVIKLAKKYKVSRSTIYEVINKEAWRNI